ncbi:hypothetical protein HAX54_019373 [Datura stramonium]|uniref:NAC domain-containing protein n=1 Tax=Datura stramonium TaxID=4076 RepID=A0ABS8URE1_DATST|nr:hypothetical protein [Datura stramonium]
MASSNGGVPPGFRFHPTEEELLHYYLKKKLSFHKFDMEDQNKPSNKCGFWKATGRNKCIRNGFKKIGMRKTLVFYQGQSSHGQKTDWIMHSTGLDTDENQCEDGWVICRVFKKKNLFKIVEMKPVASQPQASTSSTSTTNLLAPAATHTKMIIHIYCTNYRSTGNMTNYSQIPVTSATLPQY